MGKKIDMRTWKRPERKLHKIGSNGYYSLGITIPATIVRELGWKPKQIIHLTKDNDKIILIRKKC